jgi:hypothetical protein
MALPGASRPSTLTSAPLNPAELVELTRFVAAEVRAGAYPVDYETEQRWHQRIYRDRRVDIWLITWLTEQGTQLHDHGGSSGSFTVVSGTLNEAVFVDSGPRAGTLRERRHGAGRNVGFGARYVHDVRNVDREPAVSVHAYSTPLTQMNFYDVEGGRLERFASLDTDHPETPAPRH